MKINDSSPDSEKWWTQIEKQFDLSPIVSHQRENPRWNGLEFEYAAVLSPTARRLESRIHLYNLICKKPESRAILIIEVARDGML